MDVECVAGTIGPSFDGNPSGPWRYLAVKLDACPGTWPLAQSSGECAARPAPIALIEHLIPPTMTAIVIAVVRLNMRYEVRVIMMYVAQIRTRDIH